MTLMRKTNRTLPSVFSDFFDEMMDLDNFGNGQSEFMPAVNISEKNDQFEIDFSVPGYEKGDFNVELDGDVLQVSAEHKEEKSDKDKNYNRKEFSYGSFKRSFTLPENIEAEKVDASYKDGILKVSLPKKTEEAPKAPKKISIR